MSVVVDSTDHDADEIAGFNEQRARARAEKIFDTSQRILATAKDRDLTPAEAADHATASALGGAALCL